MSKAVDHVNRRSEILRKSLNLFAEVGYQQVTFQQLADVCGLSRTALYKYFSTKKEIFDDAIYQVVKDINDDLHKAFEGMPELNSRGKLEHIIKTSVEMCEENPRLFYTIIEYLLGQIRQGQSVENKIRRHTVGMHYTIKNIIQEGIASGEFKHVSPVKMADLIFDVMIAAVIQIVLYDKLDKQMLNEHFAFIINAMLKEPQNGEQ